MLQGTFGNIAVSPIKNNSLYLLFNRSITKTEIKQYIYRIVYS